MPTLLDVVGRRNQWQGRLVRIPPDQSPKLFHPNAIGLDWMINRRFARDEIQSRRPVQGNLDPVALLAGGAALDREVDAVLASFAERPFIFNLGHGILPETPIAHVEQMVARVRKSRL